MAAFFERLGHRVIRTPSAHWYDVRSRFYLNFPHHRMIDPEPGELSAVFRRLPLGVRYFAPAASQGTPSYALAITCGDREYDFEALSANSRSKTRRGLARCRVERLEPSWVQAHGRAVNDDTLRRIKLRDPYPWDRYWHAAAGSDGVEVWGALADGVLAAYLVAVRAERGCEILVARSASESLRFYPNNALLFTVVRDMLKRPEVDEVFFGVESLEDYAGIDDFKLSMGFAKRPIRQRVVFHPLLRPALQSGLAMKAVAALARSAPPGRALAQAPGHRGHVRARAGGAMTDPVAVVYPDNLAALGVCRGLGAHGVRSVFLTGDATAPGQYSRYVRRIDWPRDDEAAFIHFLAETDRRQADVRCSSSPTTPRSSR